MTTKTPAIVPSTKNTLTSLANLLIKVYSRLEKQNVSNQKVIINNKKKGS